MEKRPSILFISIIDRGVIHFSAEGYGCEFIFDVLPHKQAVLQLVGWLRDHGCEGHYISIDIREAYTESGLSKIDDAIREHNPDAFGFSLCTLEVGVHYRLMQFLKGQYPKIPIIAGGTHVSALPEHTIENFPLIDYVAIGEGEFTLTEWLKAVASGVSTAKMRLINGLCFRDESWGIMRTPPRERLQNLNILPEPAYDLIYGNGTNGNRHSAFSILCSYGCRFSCTFCSVEHGHFRYLDPIRIVDRIEWAQRRFGAEYFGIRDSLWPPNAEWLEVFCDEIERRGLKIQFHFLTRVGFLNEEQLIRLKRIGARAIAMGVEAGDPEILKNIRKGITYEKARKSFRLLHEAGIFSIAFFMFGNQGEDRATIQASIDMAHELNASQIYFNVLNPFPGSEAFDFVPDDRKDWWMNKENIPSICRLTSDEMVRLSREVTVRYPLRWRYIFQHLMPWNLPRNVRRVAKRIFFLRLREYILGISERFWLTRKVIRGLKAVFAR